MIRDPEPLAGRTKGMIPRRFSELVGETLKEVHRDNNEAILFTTTDSRIFKLHHCQDCCESVLVEDICGELADLVGNPILQAEESTSDKDPEGFTRDYQPESLTWTFYRIATIKGQVVIRWRGESNGCYSEGVSFDQIS